MANPSGIFNFEDVTENGFKYKRTTSTAGQIFPLYSQLDTSIAYTMPQMSSYRTMTPTLINKAFPQRGCTRGNWWQDHYASSPGGTLNRWSTLGEVHGTSDDDLSCVVYWTFANEDDQYYFNGNEGNSTIGDDSLKFVSGFDISHVIFEASITGYTKAQYDAYVSDGSGQTASSISLEDLIANPDNYYIKKFSIHPTCYWDSTNSTWRSGSPINLVCLVDGGEVIQGISRPGEVLFCDQETSASDLGTNCDTYHLFSATQNYTITDSTQYARKGGIPVGLNTSNPYSLGTRGEWYFRPKWVATELENFIQAQVSTSSDNVNNPEQILSTGHGIVWGYDKFNVSKKGGNYSDVPGAFYYSKWDKVLSYFGLGAKLSQFLASAGCYFHLGNNANYHNILNNDNVTPDTLHLEEDIGLGVMADDGTTTGTWVIGEDIEEYEGINKKGDVVHPNFNPGGGGGGEGDDPWSGVDFGGTGAGGGGAFCSVYYMTPTQLSSLKTWSNTSAPDGFDMLPSIIGLQQLPIAVSGIPTTVKFLKSAAITPSGESRVVDTGVAAGTGTGQPIPYSLGSIHIDRRMQQRGEPYLDYDCTIELFLPFAGTFVLDTQAVMGRTISAQIVIDPVNGTAFAYAWVENSGEKMPIAYGGGPIAVELPIASNQWGIARAAFVQARGQAIQNAVKAVGEFAAGMIGMKAGAEAAGDAAYLRGFQNGGRATRGAVHAAESGTARALGAQTMSQGLTSATGIGNSIVSATQLNNTNYTAVNGGFGGSYAEWSQPFSAYVRITRPKFKKPDNFNHTQGVPCVETKKLSACSGLTYCVNPDLSAVPCTQAEKIMITQALVGGVYAGGGES